MSNQSSVTPVGQEQPAPPIINIRGQTVALGPLNHDHMHLYLKWINDFEVVRTLSVGLAPVTAESEEDWYDQTHKNPRLRAFTIYQSSTMRPIGNTVLADIDYINRTAEFGIMIGEKDCWGKGYGAETATLILDYAFTGLGLHSVLVRAYAYNERGLGAYARAGFKLIGRRREALQRAGRYYDIVYLDCLASEYKSPVLYTLFPGDQL